MQQYRYLKYSATFIMFCLLVHENFMYLIVMYVIYFIQYFLLMIPNSTFFLKLSHLCFVLAAYNDNLKSSPSYHRGHICGDFFPWWLDLMMKASEVVTSWWQISLSPHFLQGSSGSGIWAAPAVARPAAGIQKLRREEPWRMFICYLFINLPCHVM